jgi:two-component system chemotaxis response regulator CheB
MSKVKEQSPNKRIKILIVDDSWVLRRVLRGTLSQRDDMQIVGEATNGVEALEMVLNLEPDVILLDVEMPIMDGLTTLQHLMIHTPISTIMLSSLSKVGTARCFDALKYGAVDFVSKDSFFKGMDGTAHSKLVTRKILAAAGISPGLVDPVGELSRKAETPKKKKVVFCEECGTRNQVANSTSASRVVHCKKCGDEIALEVDKRYRRMNYLTVIGAGESGYGNLLKIIPALNPDMGGAIFVMIHDDPAHVKSFVKYLDSISDFQVALGGDGVTVEGGCCYLFSGQEVVSLSSNSGQYRLQVRSSGEPAKHGAIDTLMASVASFLGDRALGVLLSGDVSDGSAGMVEVMQHNGMCMVLSPGYCLEKAMVENFSNENSIEMDFDETALAKKIQERHLLNKEHVVTA